jgi:hypothetical protein
VRQRVPVLLVAVTACICIVSWSFAALADLELRLQASATTVEVNQAFSVQLQAMSSGDSPEAPKLELPSSFTARGPSVGTNHQVTFNNGRLVRKAGITATWQVVGKTPGTFNLGPGVVQLGGQSHQSRALSIKVVPEGSLPKRAARPGPRSPFDDDFFQRRRPGRSLFDELFPDVQPDEPPSAPAELQLDKAPDPHAFLRAVVQPQTAVVGQQVTLDIYAYGSQGRFRENAPKEPRRTDFVTHTLVENSGRQPVFSVTIDGAQFYVQRVRSFALFPLKAGELQIGPMEMAFYGSGYLSRKSPDGLVRRSQALTVQVSEPDSTGRPLGYRVGDVGEFELSAEVMPRKVSAGETLSVVATLRGTGNLPGHLLTPELTDIVWSEPTVRGELAEVQPGVLGGERSFTYVVRMAKPGKYDLGQLSLPHFEPESGRYQSARVALGQVEVTAGSESVMQEPKTPRAELAKLLSVQKELGPAPAPVRSFVSEPSYWWWMFGMPLGVVVVRGASRGWLTLRERSRRERGSMKRAYQSALQEAERAAHTGDAARAAGALERALYAAIEAHTNVRGRGLLRAELESALMAKGLTPTDAEAIAGAFGRLDALRFSAEKTDVGPLLEHCKDLVKRVGTRKAGAS